MPGRREPAELLCGPGENRGRPRWGRLECKKQIRELQKERLNEQFQERLNDWLIENRDSTPGVQSVLNWN